MLKNVEQGLDIWIEKAGRQAENAGIAMEKLNSTRLKIGRKGVRVGEAEGTR